MKSFIAATLATLTLAMSPKPTSFEDQLEVEEVYSQAPDSECEHAIGHDGKYVDGVWMLEDDMDWEPEWRCLMRPFLRKSGEKVAMGQLSIEAKTVVDEKKRLIAVHERLVVEADVALKRQQCMSEIEIHLAKLEECELRVLRAYSKGGATYPTAWLKLLNDKTFCVNKFAEEVEPCRYVWQPQWDRYYGDEEVTIATPLVMA